MALASSNYLVKEQKLKRTLFSLEMEQSYVFKEKKVNQDKKLSPWQERKSNKINKSSKLNNNDKCQEFLKKILFKKGLQHYTKRNKTEFIQQNTDISPQHSFLKTKEKSEFTNIEMVLYPASEQKYLSQQKNRRKRKLVSCLTGQNFCPSFREKQINLVKNEEIKKKNSAFMKNLKKKYVSKFRDKTLKEKTLTTREMHQLIDQKCKTTTKAFYNFEDPSRKQFLSEREEKGRGSIDWCIPRSKKMKNKIMKADLSLYSYRTVSIQ